MSVPTNDDRPPEDGQDGTPSRQRVRAVRTAPELSDEDCRRIALAVATLLESAWDREWAADWHRQQAAAAEVESAADPPAPAPKPPSKHRPSRLAKWEAQWQADAEAES